jgi:LmbE family N-acetylglucosaminyl deacetylase
MGLVAVEFCFGPHWVPPGWLTLMARSAAQRVAVATATKGEAGTNDPETPPPDRLASARERETAQSLAAVDVVEHRRLGHRDDTLPGVPPGRGVDRVSRLIQETNRTPS